MRPFSFDINLNSEIQPDASLLFVFDGASGVLHHSKYDFHQINSNQAILNLPNSPDQTLTIEGKLFDEDFLTVKPYVCTYEQLVDFMVVEPESRDGE